MANAKAITRWITVLVWVHFIISMKTIKSNDPNNVELKKNYTQKTTTITTTTK